MWARLYVWWRGVFEWYVQQDGGGHSFDQQIDDFRALDLALNWTSFCARDFPPAVASPGKCPPES